MINMNNYYLKIDKDDKKKVLEKKIIREIILYIVFSILTITIIPSIILVSILSIFYRLKESNLVEFISIGGVIYSIYTYIIIKYSDKEPLKNTNSNDKLLIWIDLLKDNIQASNKDYCKFSFNYNKLLFVTNKVLGQLEIIQYNLNNNFIFNSSANFEITRIKKLQKAIEKIIPLFLDNNDYKNYAIDLLDAIIENYGSTLAEELIIEEKNVKIIDEVKNKKLESDNILLEKILCIEELNFSKEKNESGYIKIVKDYLRYILILALIFLSVYIINNSQADSTVGTLSAVITIIGAISTLLSKRHEVNKKQK